MQIYFVLDNTPAAEYIKSHICDIRDGSILFVSDDVWDSMLDHVAVLGITNSAED